MVIVRRVRGRFSITRLLSRSVRFYFVLSHSHRHSLPSYSLSLLFPLVPSFLPTFLTTKSSRVLWSLDTLVPFYQPSPSLCRSAFVPSCTFLALLFLDLTFHPDAFPLSLSVTRPDALAPPADPSYSPLPSPVRHHPRRLSLGRLSRSPFLFSHSPFVPFLLDRSLSLLRWNILTFATPVLACYRR